MYPRTKTETAQPADSPPYFDSPSAAPLQHAKKLMDESIVLLPAMQRPLALHTAKAVLSKLHQAYQKQATEKMIGVDGFIPQSARIQFELAGNKQTQIPEEFEALNTKTDEAIKAFQHHLGMKIKQLANLTTQTASTKLSLMESLQWLDSPINAIMKPTHSNTMSNLPTVFTMAKTN